MASASLDIDRYLNPFIPRSRLYLLPRPLPHFLGHRPPNSAPKSQPHILVIWAWCFIGAFCGVALIEGVYLHLPRLSGHQSPLIIASFGAAAILEYNTIESPLAQPRNLVFGHFLSALVGVCITKLFALLPEGNFESLRWLAGALSVGAASVLMAMTKTIHPPAGATALLTATSPDITILGWWLLPLVLLGCMLMLTSALILNNISRRFPIYWWTPVDLATLQKNTLPSTDVENSRSTAKGQVQSMEEARTVSETDRETDRDGKSEVPQMKQDELRLSFSQEHDILISEGRVVVPDWFQVDEWEMSVLQIFQRRLATGPRDDRGVSGKEI